MFDVAIVGSGPAGASCAAFCAMAGLLGRLGIAEEVRALPHGKLDRVDFIAIGGHTVSIALPPDAEIAVKRSLFDQLLLQRAARAGAEVRDGVTVTSVENRGGWQIKAGTDSITTRALVAADGRNSTIARLLGLMPRIEKERVALQTHLPLPKDFGDRVVLQFLPQGYSGQAPVGNNELNLCLVGKPKSMPALRAWAESRFGVSSNHSWRTITPLRRDAIPPAHQRLFFVGDAARVVEPFTGEGIYYALRSGELAAETIAANRDDYAIAHERLYRGRLWINRIARTAVLSPRMTSILLRSNFLSPTLLRALTAKVVL
jgi:flavin-dependent dehydrogenase